MNNTSETKSRRSAFVLGGLLNMYVLGLGLGLFGVVMMTDTASASCTIDLGASCNNGNCTLNVGYCDGGRCTANIIASCNSGQCTININGRCEGGTCQIIIGVALDYPSEPQCRQGCSSLITIATC